MSDIHVCPTLGGRGGSFDDFPLRVWWGYLNKFKYKISTTYFYFIIRKLLLYLFFWFKPKVPNCNFLNLAKGTLMNHSLSQWGGLHPTVPTVGTAQTYYTVSKSIKLQHKQCLRNVFEHYCVRARIVVKDRRGSLIGRLCVPYLNILITVFTIIWWAYVIFVS